MRILVLAGAVAAILSHAPAAADELPLWDRQARSVAAKAMRACPNFLAVKKGIELPKAGAAYGAAHPRETADWWGAIAYEILPTVDHVTKARRTDCPDAATAAVQLLTLATGDPVRPDANPKWVARLAEAYEHGDGVPIDAERSIALYRHAYLLGGERFARNWETSLPADRLTPDANDPALRAVIDAAAAGGNANARYLVARRLLSGGNSGDVPRAVALLEQAHMADHDGAAMALAGLYAEGKLVPADIDKAARILRGLLVLPEAKAALIALGRADAAKANAAAHARGMRYLSWVATDLDSGRVEDPNPGLDELVAQASAYNGPGVGIPVSSKKPAGLSGVVLTGLDYPAASRRAGESGTVELRGLMNPWGEVVHVAVATTSGYSRLDRAAVAAWRDGLARAQPFEPHVEGGKPVYAWVPLGRLAWTLSSE